MAEAETTPAVQPEQGDEDLRQENERLREENTQLKEKVEQQDKEINELKEKVKQDEDFSRKRKSSFGKGRFARKPRKKASEAAEDGEAPAAAEQTDAPPAEAAEQVGESSPEKKATPKKKATIRDRLGKAFGRFRTPKGGYEPPQDEPTSPTSGGGVIIPERKPLTWTVARSFQKPPETEGAAVVAAEDGEYVAFKDWTNEAVREWLHDLELPRYAGTCAWTGEELLKATDDQLDKDLGVKNPLHRKKLRLTLNAIASGADLSSEILKIDVRAVAEWLEYNGVPVHVVETFVDCSVDGRLLTFLSMDDLNYMKIHATFMQATIKRGIQLLRKNDYYRSYMKAFDEPEPEPDMLEPEPASPPAVSTESAPAEESKPTEEAQPPAAAEEAKPAEATAAEGGAEAKPAEGEEEKDAAPEEEKKPEEPTAEEKEKREAEASKERQRRRNEQLAKALCEQKPVVNWSNSEVMVWVRSIDLQDYAHRLRDTGVTGALMVLDPCFTPESLCNALGITGKSQPQHDIVMDKLPGLLGDEVMSDKDEASKLEGYTPLTPSNKPKKKRSLSFSGALRRRARGEKSNAVPTSGIYVCSMEVHMTEVFIEAHTKDCSVPPEPEPNPETEAATAAAAEGGSSGKGDLDDEADHETVPLVENDQQEVKPKTLADTAAESDQNKTADNPEAAHAEASKEEEKPVAEAAPAAEEDNTQG